MAAMHWQLQRTMNDAEFRATIKQLGLSRSACARFLNRGQRTIYRYAEENGTIPTETALLLNAMIELNIKPIVPGIATRASPWKAKTR